MADPTCSSCGHAMSMSRCWRLTCPSNGAGISSQLVYDRAVAQCASAARMVMRSSLFDPEPPEKVYVGIDLASGPDMTVYWERGDDTEKRLWRQLTKEKGASFRALRDFMYSATGRYVHRSDHD